MTGANYFIMASFRTLDINQLRCKDMERMFQKLIYKDSKVDLFKMYI